MPSLNGKGPHLEGSKKTRNRFLMDMGTEIRRGTVIPRKTWVEKDKGEHERMKRLGAEKVQGDDHPIRKKNQKKKNKGE